MRIENGKYQRAAAPVGGGYQWGDLVCLGRDVAVVLIRFNGWSYFLTCAPQNLVLDHSGV